MMGRRGSTDAVTDMQSDAVNICTLPSQHTNSRPPLRAAAEWHSGIAYAQRVRHCIFAIPAAHDRRVERDHVRYDMRHGLLVSIFTKSATNRSCTGTVQENTETKALVVEWARDPMAAYGFNVASMAYNNHFFFKGINTDPNVGSVPSTELIHEINKNFTSMDTFRESFIGTAEAMFGPGFVWLVQTNDRSLKILTTYLAGSPLSGAHYRRQGHDLSSHNPDSYQEAVNSVGAFGAAAKLQGDKKPKKPLGGVDIIPLLCVNTWEHVWLHDYGIKGKSDYLQAWWNKINWNQVQDTAQLAPVRQQSERGTMRKFHFHNQ